MRTTHSAGGVVLNQDRKVVLVSQRGRSWSLPKGHIDPGENVLEAARREIAEETGLTDLNLIKELGTYKRPKMNSENKDDFEEMKQMTFFLFTTHQTELRPSDSDNPEARWVAINEVEDLLTHSKDKAFFKKIKSQVKNI